MYWKLVYADGLGYRWHRKFDTQEALNAWLEPRMKDAENHTDEFPAEEHVLKTYDVFRVRETKDLPGMTVSLFGSPRDEKALETYLVTAAEYVKDKEVFKDLFPEDSLTDITCPYLLRGRRLKNDGTAEEEEDAFAVLTARSVGDLIDDGGGALGRGFAWACPTTRVPLDPYRKAVALKTDAQLAEQKKNRDRKDHVAEIKRAARRLPYPNSVYLITDDYTRTVLYPEKEDKYAYSVEEQTPDDRKPKRKYYIRPERFREDLTEFKKYVDGQIENAFGRPKPPTFEQLSLFDFNTTTANP